MQEVKTGNERRPEVERFGLGTHILLSTVPLYFFWLCPEYFFLHPHLCEIIIFLEIQPRPTVPRISQLGSFLCFVFTVHVGNSLNLTVFSQSLVISQVFVLCIVQQLTAWALDLHSFVSRSFNCYLLSKFLCFLGLLCAEGLIILHNISEGCCADRLG